MSEYITRDDDAPTTVDDLDADRYVWKSTNRGGGGTLSIHLDPGCRHLPEQSRRVRARTEFAFRSLCQNCVENVYVSDDSTSKTRQSGVNANADADADTES